MLLMSNVRRVTTGFFGKSVNTGNMLARLPIFLLLWWTSAATVNAESGKALLEAAVRTLEAHNSVSAKIRQEVNLFGKRLFGSGSYWEQRQGPNHLLRLELKIQLGDQTSSLLQVCDGRFLWTKCKLPDKEELGRIDVARARQALEQAGKIPGQGNLGVLPGLGGVPRMLRGLYAAFDFTSAQPGRWGKHKRPVWRLEGRWKPEQLVKLLPDQKQTIQAGNFPDLSKLPEHLPDHVVLLLGQEARFPYRIEYRRTDGCATRVMVAMDLYDVDINVPIDPNRFVYNPGDLKYSDETDRFLESLKE